VHAEVRLIHTHAHTRHSDHASSSFCFCWWLSFYNFVTFREMSKQMLSVLRDFRWMHRANYVAEQYRVNLFNFIHEWLFCPLLGPGLIIILVISFTQMVGLLERVISTSQGRYLNTGQHKHRINAHTDIHDLNRIRTHDPTDRESEDISFLRPRGHCDRHFIQFS
jgi:hypothetical protein